MKTDENEIEKILRAAPVPRPPEGLKESLMPAYPQTSRPTPAPRPNGFHLRDWWPALATAAVALACVVVLAVQHNELKDLRQRVAVLQEEQAAAAAAVSAANRAAKDNASAVVPNTRQDLERLRATEKALAGAVTALETLRAENDQLRKQAAASTGLAPEDVQPMLDARDKARSIACVNNLKQLGLSARVWATDNGDILPPDILSMSNEIAAPKILVCPADEGRQPAANWSVFTLANTSYEFLAASGSELDPLRVAFRCPIHGHVGLVDGSVQGSVGKTHPERFTSRDGKLYLESGRAAVLPTGGQIQMDPRMAARYGLAPGATGAAPAQPAQMSEEMMRRYGLLPPDDAGQFVPADPEPAP